MKPYSLFFVLIAFISTLIPGGCSAKRSGPKSYEFTPVRRGSLEQTVSSSGTINPVSTVKVLPRMSGKVEKIYVDYNDTVRKGDILAELNTDMLRLQREQQLAQVIKGRANFELQQVNYRNQQALAEKDLISEYELKTGKTTLDIQAAELSAAEANLKAIETEINQYAYITSPIDGIVLERNITEGDTVVDSSSSNSTSIFTLAENLQEMQIESWVGELDISSILQDQEVRFTLESFPGRNFSGLVESKRLMPSVQDNVVSYKVIISVQNRDGSLLPGMSCAVEFIQQKTENVLLIPNAALRYQPTTLSADEISEKTFNAGLTGMSEEQRTAAIEARAEAQKSAAPSGQTGSSQASSGLAGLVMPAGGRMRPPGGGQNQNRNAAAASPNNTPSPPKPLWYLDANGKPDCILVRTGISDGVNTEIRLLGAGRGGDGRQSGDGQADRVEQAVGETDLENMQVILRERI
jgi:HlyD family secretion protein